MTLAAPATAADRVYWANAGDDTIRGAPLTGSGPVTTLYDSGDGVNAPRVVGPHGVAVDPAGARI